MMQDYNYAMNFQWIFKERILMKRLICLILASAFVLSVLAACGGDETDGEQQAEQTGSEQAVDLQTVYQLLLDMQADTGREELALFAESDPVLIESFYSGLSEINLKQRLFYMAPVTGYACEVMLVEAADKSDVQRIDEIFQNRINIGATTGSGDTKDLWANNAAVQTSGSCVAMIVLPDGYVIPENIFETTARNSEPTA